MERAMKTTVYQCKKCNSKLIPTYAVVNDSECVSCRMKAGKPINISKGSYACYLNSPQKSENIVEYKIDRSLANPF